MLATMGMDLLHFLCVGKWRRQWLCSPLAEWVDVGDAGAFGPGPAQEQWEKGVSDW